MTRATAPIRRRTSAAPIAAPMARRIAALAMVAAVGGCGADTGGRVVSAESGAVDISIPRPVFTLTDTDGKPFAFAERTTGRLTFLEFGYTNCPDVCPVHMANLSTVLANLAPSDRMRTTVVFVTVDPDRDSTAALRRWLDAFSTEFIGLRGSRDEVNAIQKSVGFGPAVIETDAGGATTVMHASPVLVFTADDTAHVMYPFGTRQSDWARDIPLLLARRGRGERAAAEAPTPSIERAYVVIPAGQGPAALYFIAKNPGASADTIVAIGAAVIGAATLHESVHDRATGSMTMKQLAALAVPARGDTRLAPGGAHGMIGPLSRPLVRGEQITLTVRFAHAGAVRARATVITYADVDTATARR